MKIRSAKKVLRRLHGHRYGPKAPGYTLHVALRAMARAVRWCGRWKPGQEEQGAMRVAALWMGTCRRKCCRRYRKFAWELQALPSMTPSAADTSCPSVQAGSHDALSCQVPASSRQREP